MTNGGRLARRVALDGMLFALAVVMSVVDGMIPTPVPGVRLGLSNIAVMYTLLFVGRRDALTLAALKGLFAFVTRGAIAGALSLSGGLLSVLVMTLLTAVFGERVSYIMLSVAGALAHNAGQMIVVKFVYSSLALSAFAPVLAISGIAAGVVTAAILRAFLPIAKRFGGISGAKDFPE
ncbi:MAG: Gx transporter family protein [Oscillospiraceae bacterium]|jgi:heptaprenyl diphosphate synthase|nr:Gx transporter family protein [Oscillospiraceae bacterium]